MQLDEMLSLKYKNSHWKNPTACNLQKISTRDFQNIIIPKEWKQMHEVVGVGG